MKRLFLVVLSIITCYGYLFSQTIPIVLPMTEKELERYSTKTVVDWEYNYSAEIDKKYKEITKDTDALYESLTIKTNKNERITLVGQWILLDEKGIKPDTSLTFEKYSQFTGNSFDVIIMDNCEMLLRSYDQSSYVYFSKKRNMYISPTYSFIPIRKLVFVENKLFFYYPEDMEWRLDGVHDGGKNAFVRSVIPSGG